MLRSILFSLVILVGSAFAQVTPYLNLSIPNPGTQNWNVLLNNNFTTLDNYLSGQPGFVLPAITVTNFSLTNTLTFSGNSSELDIAGVAPTNWTLCTTFGSRVCPYTFSATAPANSLQVNSSGVLVVGKSISGAGAQMGSNSSPCSTIASLNASCVTTITWPTSFGDANYKAVCQGKGAAVGLPVIGVTTSFAATTMGISTYTINSSSAGFSEIDCWGVHN